MQAARLALRTALRTLPRSTHPHPLRPSQASSRFLPRAQTRHASFQYKRFPGKEGQEQQWSNFGPFYRAQYVWRNYRRPIIVVGSGGAVFYVYNLEEAPITHRRRFNYISRNHELLLSNDGYQEILNQCQGRILPPDHRLTQQVAKIVERLLPSAHLPEDEQWRVHVINDPKQMNAFVIPGGKVFVFSGLLPITKDESGLAAVLAHEIAHNSLNHMGERVSQASLAGLVALTISIFTDWSGQISNTLASLALSLPNSRTQEQEADYVGLLMMAESCYDPEAAVGLWTRMQQAEQVSVPQFISTHPTSYNRRELIKQWLPEARQRYEESDCSTMGRYVSDFKEIIQPSSAQNQSVGQRQPVYQQGQNQNNDDDFF